MLTITIICQLPYPVLYEMLSGVGEEEDYAKEVYGKGCPECGIVAQVLCNGAAGKDAQPHSNVPTYQQG